MWYSFLGAFYHVNQRLSSVVFIICLPIRWICTNLSQVGGSKKEGCLGHLWISEPRAITESRIEKIWSQHSSVRWNYDINIGNGDPLKWPLSNWAVVFSISLLPSHLSCGSWCSPVQSRRCLWPDWILMDTIIADAHNQRLLLIAGLGKLSTNRPSRKLISVGSPID